MDFKVTNTISKEILPTEGLWTLTSLAAYLNVKSANLMQNLTKNGIKTIHLGVNHDSRLVNMADIVKFFEK